MMLAQQAEIEAALNAIIAEKNLDLFLFVVTDILNNDSVGLHLDAKPKQSKKRTM